jgi:hypothetical protein
MCFWCSFLEFEAILNAYGFFFKSAIMKLWIALKMHNNKHLFRSKAQQGIMTAKLTRLTQQMAPSDSKL